MLMTDSARARILDGPATALDVVEPDRAFGFEGPGTPNLSSNMSVLRFFGALSGPSCGLFVPFNFGTTELSRTSAARLLRVGTTLPARLDTTLPAQLRATLGARLPALPLVRLKLHFCPVWWQYVHLR